LQPEKSHTLTLTSYHFKISLYLATNLYNNNSNTVKHFGETLIAHIFIIASVNVMKHT